VITSETCEARKGKHKGYEAVILENDVIRVIVLPRFRARIIEYVYKPTGNNHLYSNLESGYGHVNAGSKLIAKTGARNPSDTNTLGGHISIEWTRVKYRISSTGGGARIVMKVEYDGIDYEVIYGIGPHSSAIDINYKMTNMTPGTIIGQLNFHTLWSVGGEPYPGSILSVESNETDNSLVYWPTTPTTKWVESHSGVATISSSRTLESVSITADKNLARFMLFSNRQAYNLEAYSRPSRIARGKSISFSLQTRIIPVSPITRDLNGASFGVHPAKRFLTQPKPIKVRGGAASSVKAIDGNITMSLRKHRRAKPIAVEQQDFHLEPGAKEWSREKSIPTRGLPDGRYILKIESRINGKTETQYFPIHLIGEWLRHTGRDLKGLRKRLPALAKKLIGGDSPTAPWETPAIAGAVLRLQQARRMFETIRKNEIDDPAHINRVTEQIRELNARLDLLEGKLPSSQDTYAFLRKADAAQNKYYYTNQYESFSERITRYRTALPTITADSDKVIRDPQAGPIRVIGVDAMLRFDFACAHVITDGVPQNQGISIARALEINKPAQTRNGRNIPVIYVTSPKARLTNRFPEIQNPDDSRPFVFFKKTGAVNVGIISANTARERLFAADFIFKMVSLLKDRKVLFGDLHSHTTISDGKAAPAELPVAAIQGLLDFLVVTDHNAVEGSLEVISEMRASGLKFPIIPGQEAELFCARGTHIPVFGTRKMISPAITLNELFKIVRSTNGAAVLAHPLRSMDLNTRNAEIQKSFLAKFPKPGFDAVEVVDGYFESIYANWESSNRVPNVIATSDNHVGNFAEPVRTILFAKDTRTKSILDAIREGRTLGLRNGKLFGPKELREIFLTLLEENEYLEKAARDKLVRAAKALGRSLPKLV